MSVWGTGQLSLTKCIITVPSFVDSRDIKKVLGYLGANFNPEKDLTLLQTTPLDTLDFTSGKINVGSKVGLNAVGDGKEISQDNFQKISILDPRTSYSKIKDYRVINKNIIIINSLSDSKIVSKEILESGVLDNFKIIFIVDTDIKMNDDVDLLWGIFTRFDPTLDINFKKCRMSASSVKFSGTMIVDATQKDWYPKVLTMSPDIINKVAGNWKKY
jgi:4-hydroxy-3-polyprenylbenzoate decarboxylase